jgi:hypothetical protein
MPFTYSIANGIVFGIVSYAAIKLLSGRRDVHPIMAVLALLMASYYAFAGRRLMPLASPAEYGSLSSNRTWRVGRASEPNPVVST